MAEAKDAGEAVLGPNTKRTDSTKRSGRLALCNDVVEGLGILDQSNTLPSFASTGNEYGSRKLTQLVMKRTQELTTVSVKAQNQLVGQLKI